MLTSNCSYLSLYVMVPGTLWHFVCHYLFPLLIVLGVVGNGLNLMVLLDRKMRTKSNIFFAAMAFADMGFLLCWLPDVLASFGLQYGDFLYVSYIYVTHHLTLPLSNWLSAVSIWVMVAVTAERCVAIRDPLGGRRGNNSWFGGWRSILALCFGGCFVLTFHHHVTFAVGQKVICAGSVVAHLLRRRNSAFIRAYVKTSTIANVIGVIVVPLLVLVVLNSLLVISLRRHLSQQVLINESRKQGHTGSSEKKVTIMVVIIVFCFVLTVSPGGILYVYLVLNDWMYVALTFFAITYGNIVPTLEFRVEPHFHQLAGAVANSLTIFGKVINFILFCTSSTHFRQRLCERLSSCYDGAFGRCAVANRIKVMCPCHQCLQQGTVTEVTIAKNSRALSPTPVRNRQNTLTVEKGPKTYRTFLKDESANRGSVARMTVNDQIQEDSQSCLTNIENKRSACEMSPRKANSYVCLVSDV